MGNATSWPGATLGRAMVPSLTDGVIVLNGHTDDDVAAHLAGEDDETARWFGWWPQALRTVGR